VLVGEDLEDALEAAGMEAECGGELGLFDGVVMAAMVPAQIRPNGVHDLWIGLRGLIGRMGRHGHISMRRE